MICSAPCLERTVWTWPKALSLHHAILKYLLLIKWKTILGNSITLTYISLNFGNWPILRRHLDSWKYSFWFYHLQPLHVLITNIQKALLNNESLQTEFESFLQYCMSNWRFLLLCVFSLKSNSDIRAFAWWSKRVLYLVHTRSYLSLILWRQWLSEPTSCLQMKDSNLSSAVAVIQDSLVPSDQYTFCNLAFQTSTCYLFSTQSCVASTTISKQASLTEFLILRNCIQPLIHNLWWFIIWSGQSLLSMSMPYSYVRDTKEFKLFIPKSVWALGS